jgi:hypothetical protein
MEPRYIHDCSTCTFLGTYSNSSHSVDLYFCPASKTLISRRSSDGPDYVSGLAFVGIDAEITEAYVRAYRKGLLEITVI